MNQDIKQIGPYKLGITLGTGSCSIVKMGTHIENNETVAIKVIPKKTFMDDNNKRVTESSANNKKILKKLDREIGIMKLIQHVNILQLKEVHDTDNHLYLVLEYAKGGELFDFLVKRGRFSEMEAIGYFRQIASAIHHCHSLRICHRDLKPENILLDKDKNCKVADFGMATRQYNGKFLSTSCGSPHYASPEVIKGIQYDGMKSDIWSLGVILYALLTGTLPFDDENIRILLQKVKSGKFRFPTYLSIEAKDLIRNMMRVDPIQRMDIHQVLNHSWMTLNTPNCMNSSIDYESLDSISKINVSSCDSGQSTIVPTPSSGTRKNSCDGTQLQSEWNLNDHVNIIQFLLANDVKYQIRNDGLIKCKYVSKVHGEAMKFKIVSELNKVIMTFQQGPEDTFHYISNLFHDLTINN